MVCLGLELGAAEWNPLSYGGVDYILNENDLIRITNLL